ncbi:hypothetical protein [Streptomyces sp. NPDC094472]|uniref:hypothetical protein n=1 Tax=Streptomyces sp. NPDC094472 TaxID=3155080 RepID=UPI00332ED908
MQIEASRAEAEEARKEVAKQEKISRLVEIRTALREWQEVLDRAVQRMWSGASFDLETFDDAENSASRKASRAIDAVMHDEWFIPQSKYDRPGPGGRHETSVNAQVTTALRAYRDLIRENLLSGSRVSPDRLRELMYRQDGATKMRGTMSTVIESRVRAIHRGEDEDPGRIIPRDW